jgi:hypothetical protein
VKPPTLKFHALGVPPLQVSRFMGHAKVTTTLSIYTHLFDDDHAETMAALEALSRPVRRAAIRRPGVEASDARFPGMPSN